ncbi:hypothetical protein EAI30_07160 [Romboutsia ilealis]|uniref:Energy-coupling factor transport system substrate-specific component n=1 Tax=Romboutsia faecis TaxID=2764597 RepID=A0ABR7JKB7_9FIRM|nr:hypothetical protein [Romboutsia faecis]MBC5995364.1 hypothetical protein [Romboutsia faecis]MRN24391.1 hypothetical protein [Romboutsia ilealis]
MNTKDIVLIGLLAALLKSSQAILSFLPNIEIVSLLILIFSIRLGAKKTIYITVVFSTLNIMLWGFSPATIGYFFVWSGYSVVCSICGKFLNKDIKVAIFLGLFGIIFGALFALIYLPMGYAYVLTYWINGLTFDIIHTVSNFIIGLWAFTPVLNGFDRAMKIIYRKNIAGNKLEGIR